MATGSYDANGIWQYGEDDNIALFSTTLNKLAASASSAFTSDRSRISTLEANNLPGTIPVVPGSITKSGGTSSVTALGQVSVTGVTYVILNSVFTSKFRNYKVIVNYGNTTTSGYIYGALTQATTQMGATCRYVGVIGSGSGTVVNLSGANLAYFPVNEHANYNMKYGHAEYDILNPQLTVLTNFSGQSHGVGPTYYTEWSIGGIVQDTTAYDGLKIYSSGGATFDAIISVYGYNN